ncbi:hypothetical protein GCM10027280_26780 [Micromonospora polyrhachis]
MGAREPLDRIGIGGTVGHGAMPGEGWLNPWRVVSADEARTVTAQTETGSFTLLLAVVLWADRGKSCVRSYVGRCGPSFWMRTTDSC